MSEAIGQQEPETIEAGDVAELVQPLPEVNTAAIDAAREQEATAQAEAAQPNAPAPSPTPAAAPLPASAAAPAAAAKPKPQGSRVAVTDEKGRPFDPLLHECTDDGQPLMRSAPNDRWVRCRRQPLKEFKRKSVVADDAAPAPQAEPVRAAPVVDPAKQLVAAQTMAGLQLLAMRAALGPKIGEADAEREELTNGWLGVLQYYGIGGSFHPVIGLALISGGLVVGALKHDDTRSRLTKLRDWAQRKALGVWQLLHGGVRRSKGWATNELDQSMQRA